MSLYFNEYLSKSRLSMFKSLIQDTRLLLLLLTVLLLKLFSLQPAWVERYYSHGLYPHIARGLRLLLGWLPFSMGDLLYAAAVIFLFYAAWRLLLLIRARRLKGSIRNILYRVMKTALWIYLFFNVLWGLNYNRLGISSHLGLTGHAYGAQDVRVLAQTLQDRLNAAAEHPALSNRAALGRNDYLSRETKLAYDRAAEELRFLTFKTPSFKASLYAPVGHFIGYTGYYNPFTGEAQINTTIPSFLKPFVVCHEVAHQLGYGRENEANFVGFLAAKKSEDPHFRYALYFDMYRYALRELSRLDTTAAAASRKLLHPLVLRDNEELRSYFLKTQNKIEPLASAFYDRYLKLNSQAKGIRTYNEVVALLIAYQKKYGNESL